MNKRVLVSGVGGGIGQSILKSLQGTAYTAIATDADPLAAGLYAAERAYRIPRADSPEFLPRIERLRFRSQCGKPPGHQISRGPGTCFHCGRGKAAFSCARDKPKPLSISPVSRVFGRVV